MAAHLGVRAEDRRWRFSGSCPLLKLTVERDDEDRQAEKRDSQRQDSFVL